MKRAFPPSPQYMMYYLVSTKRQGDSGLGLDAQRAYVEHIYKSKPIIAGFTDVQSGKDVFNRPESMKALVGIRYWLPA